MFFVVTSVEAVFPAGTLHSQLLKASHADPQWLGGLSWQEEPLGGAGVAADHPALPAVVPPVHQGELHLLAVHAGVGLTVRHPHGSVGIGCLLPRFFQQIFTALMFLVVKYW